jgi:hypothetical protein
MLIRGKQIADNTISKDKLDFAVSYEHIQTIPATTWTINHSLGKFTNVTIYDTDNKIIDAEVETLNNNTIRVVFNILQTGRVIIT